MNYKYFNILSLYLRANGDVFHYSILLSKWIVITAMNLINLLLLNLKIQNRTRIHLERNFIFLKDSRLS